MVPESVKALDQIRGKQTQVVKEQGRSEARQKGVLEQVEMACNSYIAKGKQMIGEAKRKLGGIFGLVAERKGEASNQGNHLLGLPAKGRKEEEVQWRQRLNEILSEVDSQLAGKKTFSALLVIMVRLFALFEDANLGHLDRYARVQKDLEGILNLKNQVESKFVLFQSKCNKSEAEEVCDLYFGHWEGKNWIPGIRGLLDQGEDAGHLEPKLVEKSKDIFEKEILLGVVGSKDCATLSQGPGVKMQEREKIKSRVADALAKKWYDQWNKEPASLQEKEEKEGGGSFFCTDHRSILQPICCERVQSVYLLPEQPF